MNSQKQGKTGSGTQLVIRNGILYGTGVDSKTKEEIAQLAVPVGKREEALRWAHECPLAGHMKEAATTARLLARMYWPGIHADIKGFCETCGPCQLTQPKGRPGGRGSYSPCPLLKPHLKGKPWTWCGLCPKGKEVINTY